MQKFYRVIKENPLWEVGAILVLTDTGTAYAPINDLWNLNLNVVEYLKREVIENQPLFFERVYKDDLLNNCYRTVEEMKKRFNENFRR